MKKRSATIGALTIMMASGTVLDFDVSESDNETFVRIWSSPDQDGSRVKKHVVAILPSHVEERHVLVET